VDARAEVAAEDVVNQFQRNLIGSVEWRSELCGENDALAGAGAVNEIDDVFVRVGNFGNVERRDFAGFPSGKQLFKLWSDFSHGGVPNDEEGGIVGLGVGVVNLDEIVASHFVDGGSRVAGAGGSGGIGRIAAMKDQREIDDGSSVAFRENDFEAVGEFGFLHGRKIERHGGAESGRMRTIDRLGGLEVGRIGLNFENIVAIGQPTLGRFLDGSGRGCLDALEVGFVAIGIPFI